jgi:hypothetical protein
VRDEVTKQFGAKEAGGLTMYAVSRALQFRPLRRPPPRVRRGQSA